MGNLHPAIAAALAPFAPNQQQKVFVVTIHGHEPLSVMATNTATAISRAIEILFNVEEDCPPDGLTITAQVMR